MNKLISTKEDYLKVYFFNFGRDYKVRKFIWTLFFFQSFYSVVNNT